MAKARRRFFPTPAIHRHQSPAFNSAHTNDETYHARHPSTLTLIYLCGKDVDRLASLGVSVSTRKDCLGIRRPRKVRDRRREKDGSGWKRSRICFRLRRSRKGLD